MRNEWEAKRPPESVVTEPGMSAMPWWLDVAGLKQRNPVISFVVLLSAVNERMPITLSTSTDLPIVALSSSMP